MIRPVEIYDLMSDIVKSNDAPIDELIVGLTWTYCRSLSTGLCMTADSRSRTYEWPGSVRGQKVSSVSEWISDWNPMKSSIALAAINSVTNQNILAGSTSVTTDVHNANLAVFEYFLPVIKNKKCVVIGRYPGLDIIEQHCNLTVLELNPDACDLPSTAAEYLLPEAEWVFISGTSIANKTFPRLMSLSKNANVVLMGPSVPWIEELSAFGVDFIAGTEVMDTSDLRQVVSEGGGVNIFSQAVRYFVCDLGKKRLEETRIKISNTVKQRESLKDEMQLWYKDISNRTFPKVSELVVIDEELSRLDSQYKQMWDLRNSLVK